MMVADAPALYCTVGDPKAMKYWAGGPDQRIEDTERRIAEIEEHWKEHGFGDWGVVEKQRNELIGFSGLHYIKDMPEVNLGYAFKESTWRKGYASEVCRSVLGYGFKTLGLPLVVAIIWPENIASVGLAQKRGMNYWKEFAWGGGPRVVYSMSLYDWIVSNKWVHTEAAKRCR